ncbi:methyltransferase family protein [Phenylobacterium montanum]|uniref:Isoprenylcysteine carboxylmethyltransferase family protein n=1 Tax=Phenylobacterium montanum TaxID=2823693 RepID=A0A975G172_9CAUL|nr:isoprenylcysteine carboxylmethyltransferase family protein [Caulobacter sp. S6]QUD88672.1 isoprenylcysteine carboxylmethyltransferase family protein [Caulobacter sp. S6]
MISPFNVIFWIWDAWALSWVIAALWAAPAARRVSLWDQGLYWAITALGIWLLLVVRVPAGAAPGHIWVMDEAPGWLLVAVTAAGLGFCWWARLHLGQLWSGTVTRKAGHHVVDTGPYALVRHPIYSGLILAGAATALLRGAVSGFAGAALMALGFWIKARIEERFLSSELGDDAYEAYRRRTPMLIPGLGRQGADRPG